MSFSSTMAGSSWHAQQLSLVRGWVGDPSLDLPASMEPGSDARARALARADADRVIATVEHPTPRLSPPLEGPLEQIVANLLEARGQVLAGRSLPGLRRNLEAWHQSAMQAVSPGRRLDSEFYLLACGRSEVVAEENPTSELASLFEVIEDADEFLAAAVTLARTQSVEEPEPPAGPKPTPEPNPSSSRRATSSESTGSGPLPKGSAARRYEVYSDLDDEVTTPGRLVSPGRARALRRTLDTALRTLPALEQTRWRALERNLRARGRPRWVFQQRDGILDSARVARIVAQPAEPLVFKQERAGPSSPVTVSLLIDSSRSMGGAKIMAAALAVELLSSALEAAAIAVEVLGYTTRDWHGGEPRRRWEAAGRPPQPGRLCALRHVVYKAADTPIPRARGSFGVFLESSLLKENVDGEAIEWAHRRLLRRPGRRVLVVLCDGAPECDATRRANAASYLTRHLRDVVEAIEAQRRVELVALGFERRVARLYPRHVVVPSADELGPALRQLIHELASGGSKSDGSRRSR